MPHQLLTDVEHRQQVVAVGVGGQKAGHGGAQAAGAQQDGGQLFAGRQLAGGDAEHYLVAYLKVNGHLRRHVQLQQHDNSPLLY